ncbi:MAG TPA: DUF302 domain-containing protein [Candidatus Dormibacteraeota bacterium]|nr:DUF302 domain-containing protein [Candidatus Dormibacteraeota bacterium]
MDSATTKLTYGSVVTTKLPYAEAIERTKALLKEEGFGVLCEIDVAKTMKEKIGADFRPYVILGACNPQFAHQALSQEDQLGLLLPCNVVVQQGAAGTLVSAIDAQAMLGIVGNPEMTPVAQEVNARLGRVLERIAAA